MPMSKYTGTTCNWSKTNAKAASKRQALRPPEDIRLPNIDYPRYGFVETGEVRPPQAGEWFKGILGYPRQASFDYQRIPRPILIPEEEYNRRLKRFMT